MKKTLPILLSFALMVSAHAQSEAEREGVETVVRAIEELEGQSDPKCHATATRLENFMYGTPLTADAREKKVELQRELITSIWTEATTEARANAQSTIGGDLMRDLIAERLLSTTSSSGDVFIETAAGNSLEITSRDARQYSSVAYALRAILSVQQDALFDPSLDLLPMDPEAIDALKFLIDVGTLASIQTGDRIARAREAFEIDAPIFEASWEQVFGDSQQAVNVPLAASSAVEPGLLLRRIIEQKVRSYDDYHAGTVSGQLLFNNVRSYYARHDWPEDENSVARIQSLFLRLMTNVTGRYVERAQQIAAERGDAVVREPDVAAVLDEMAPFQINEYEDITYFYNLPRDQSVQIESYDADSFRDSGTHWTLIENVLDSPHFDVTMDFDPFGAELLAEGVAQMGVLVFRVAGLIAKEERAPVLAPKHLVDAVARIDDLMQLHLDTPARPQEPALLASSSGETNTADPFFIERTAASGVDYVHRSADWVKRFERSFVYVNENAEPGDESSYLLDVPPVFGGSGIAATDLDSDGIDDLLILGGLGNRLYRGMGDGSFQDVTRGSGIEFIGQDGKPGEPRQPLLADFDNDGIRDIFISYVDADHRIYQGLGEMKFRDVSDRAGLGGEGLVGSSATAADFDRDGLLDLYISYYGNYLAGDGPTIARVNEGTTPNRLFRNLGGFRFEDMTDGSGTDNSGWTQAAAAVDFNGDGWQDLIVGNDFGVNAWYLNRGDWTFENVVEKLDARLPSNSMNVGTADLNRDGYPDVYISNIFYMVKDEKYVLPTEDTPMKRNPVKLGTMRIFDANHLFTSVAGEEGLERYAFSFAVDRGETATGWAWDADFFDFDNDGDDDLYVVNGLNEYNIFRPKRYDSEDGSYEYGRPGYEASVNVREPNAFFVNEGGKLRNRSKESGADLAMNARGAVYLDFDRDGDLDVVVNNFNERAVVLENRVGDGSGNWLEVELIGDPKLGSNRDAIGATAVAVTPSGERIWRALQAGTGYLSDHPKVLHYGLGDAGSVDLHVRWPNGEEQIYRDLGSGERHRIVQTAEPEASPQSPTTASPIR